MNISKIKPVPALAIVLLTAFLLTVVLPIISNYDKSASNTFLLDHDYSHLSRQQIIEKITTDFPLPANINLTANDKTIPLNLASISAQIDANKTASTILYRRLNQGIPAYVKYFFSPKKFELEVSYDTSLFNQVVDNVRSHTDKVFTPSELTLQKGQVVYRPGILGQELDVDIFRSQLLSRLSQYQPSSPLPLVINQVGQIPDSAQIEKTRKYAQNIVGKSLILNSPWSDPITVTDTTLISFLDFWDNYSETNLSDFLGYTSESLKRQPVNAIFTFENGKVTEFRPATPGVSLNADEFSKLIKTSIPTLASSSQKSLAYPLPITTIPPQIRTEDANNLGIKELIGRGTSTFKHSTAVRNLNVERGAAIVNRLLVAPNETFSFVKSLGEVTLDNGFKKAYIIRQGRTELDVGGGICQVSTTFFRAILNAGLDITERKNHAYRVSYYEEDMPPGYDATVFIPSPDLKFVNDTGHHLLIQSHYDGQQKRLTYEIYGTSDGRQVDISNYRQWGASPPPPDVYIDDPTLPLGKVIQEEHRIPGLKTAFDWKVTRNNQIIHQKTFQSNFVPWAAVFRRGTGP